ncbi:heavy-metal-associated domain-containing protein [Roseateles saccharophilus]|uniref:Copper chaperone n=1 Tax=Roseateles saccharophilus TaxID=304 RepID=A0A4R3VEG7_ROSSA|nr:heavy-metal-associated domain-containing protein [Roseateles saccharophilus]MDG0832292.1 copper chaperone [Roseateles saccharophilus]TCV02333.1 copper chaperone [Roseateles saccharophilus]
MIAFEVNDMSCGHCVGAITEALKAVDRDARVEIDLAQHRVQVESGSAGAEQLAEAIRGAGYSPVPVAPAAGPAAAGGGSCCGCRR